jgi:polyphosphate kinase
MEPALPTPDAARRPDEPKPAEFLNREITWLEFNRRVLAQALDERTPLLERLAFLAIFNSNLDEFYQKRVGGLKRQIDANVTTRTPDGMSPRDQIVAIRDHVLPMLEQQAQCYMEQVRPKLAAEGIHLLEWEDLDDRERELAARYFRGDLFPVLTPLAVDPGHPFPFISNLSESLGVMLRSDGHVNDDDAETPGLQFARVKVPQVFSQWVLLNESADGDPPDALPEDQAPPVLPADRIDEAMVESGRGDAEAPDRGLRFVRIDQIIKHHLPELFEGMHIEEVEPFRVTRNADIDRDTEDAEDLLELVEQELRDRRFARVIRLEVDDKPFRPLNRFLIRELNLHPKDVYEMPGPLEFNHLWEVHAVDRPDLKFGAWTPTVPPRLADPDASIFSIVQDGDVMVHHPYESFSASVERFIRAAANDPKVIAIKLTLYRTAKDSPFIPDLIRAAEAGKQVVVLVELKARFDEQRNLQLAQLLEKAGIHVVYGVVGFKTHTKTSLVVRQEPGGMRTYAHIGTGNYHAKTANLYTDLGLITCDRRITGDLVELFHMLTGRSVKRDFNHLLIAPTNMRRRFEEMIQRELEHCEAWKQRGAGPDDPQRPQVIAKMNSLEDQRIVRLLYKASQAGVKIQLIVRGFCCLRPGVPGMSENISVVSVIGRFLEHSRVYYFYNRGEGGYYVGSADWMYRNLNNRVECITPIYDPGHRARLRQLLNILLEDQRQAWDMQPDGTYIQRMPADDLDPKSHAAKGTHQALMDLTAERALNA